MISSCCRRFAWNLRPPVPVRVPFSTHKRVLATLALYLCGDGKAYKTLWTKRNRYNSPCAPLPINNSRIAVVMRFLSGILLRRRRRIAANTIAGSLGAFTNSNAIARYAKRVNWGSRHLQAVARRRMECLTAHLFLLSKQWDSLYLPAIPQSAPAPVPDTERASKTAAAPPTSAPSGKRSSPKRKGGGGKQKGKGASKRQGEASLARIAKMGRVDIDNAQGTGETTVDSTGEARRHQLICVTAKAKADEITLWLRRARSKHCQDLINYDRLTVR